jgi:hypothetical protein
MPTTKTKPPVGASDGAINVLVRGAEQHGEDSEPDHEVGDLQELLILMWGLLTPEQRVAFVSMPQVRGIYEDGTAQDEGALHRAIALKEQLERDQARKKK